MEGSTILLSILPILSFIIFYFIVRTLRCNSDCQDKLCPSEEICDGSKCKRVEKESFDLKNKSTRGICYFDIDDTLTSAVGDRDDIIQECLDNNFAVGIITASGRKIDDICSGDNAGGYQNATWMSNKLCKQFRENKGKLFNSFRSTDGKSVFPSDFPVGKSYGYIKGYQMKYGKDVNYPYISDKCVVLFDDNPNVLEGVKDFNPELEVQCANKNCGGLYLSNKLVGQKIKQMIIKGC